MELGSDPNSRKPILKTINALVKDLENHTYLLKAAVENCEVHNSFFILMANQLRTIVCSSSGQIDLLPYLQRHLNLDLKVFSKQNPHGRSLGSYLHDKGVFLEGKHYSNLEFIKLMCNSSGEGLHVKDEISKEEFFSKRITMKEINPNYLQLASIARTILSVILDSFFPQYGKISAEDYEKINSTYLKKKGIENGFFYEDLYASSNPDIFANGKISLIEGTVAFWTTIFETSGATHFNFFKSKDLNGAVSLELLNKNELTFTHIYQSNDSKLVYDFGGFFNKRIHIAITWSISKKEMNLYIDGELRKMEKMK